MCRGSDGSVGCGWIMGISMLMCVCVCVDQVGWEVWLVFLQVSLWIRFE